MKTDLEIYNEPYHAFDMKYEYPGYSGELRYAIATDMTEQELTQKFGEEIEAYRPFILITIEMGAAMVIYHNNDAAAHMRECRGCESYYEDFQDFTYGEDSLWDELLSQMKDSELREHLNELSQIQARRAYKYIWERKTIEQIAQEESCSVSAAYKCINLALNKLYELIFDKEEVA